MPAGIPVAIRYQGRGFAPSIFNSSKSSQGSDGPNVRRGVRMQPSMFNVRVPLEGRDDVFLMNTFTDAQLIVSRDVVDLLDRVEGLDEATETERETLEQLA